MDVRKLAITGAIVLVLIGCIVAAGCTSTQTTQQTSSSSSDGLSQVVGEWTGKYDFQGTTYDAIQTIKADGTGMFKLISGNQIYDLYTSSFSNFDGKGNFEKKSSDGSTYKMTYSNGTLTESGADISTITYTRVDPIAGIWFCDTGDNKLQKAKVTEVLLANGNGYCIESMEDGTSALLQGTWKKNTDGTYSLNWNKNYQETATINSAKDAFSNNIGSKFVKKSVDGTSRMILGPWYHKDTNRVVVFNADGTGSGINDYGLFIFTWKVDDSGEITVTYVSGFDLDGLNVAGTSHEMSYDSGSDVLTTPKGTVYIRPTETVKDRVSVL